MYGLIIFAILTICTYVYFTKVFLYWKKRGIPHPPFSKLFGNLTEAIFLKKSLRLIYNDIYNAYPDLPYVGFYKLRSPAILLRDPKLIQEVLVKNFNIFQENDVFKIDKTHEALLARNSSFLIGDEWKTSRKQIVPALTKNNMKSMFPLFESVCQNFVQHLEDPLVANGGTDVKLLCQRYGIDVVALSVLGLKFNSFTKSNTEYIKQIQSIIDPGLMVTLKFTIMMLLPFLRNVFKLKLIPDIFTNYFQNLVRQARSYRKENNILQNDVLNSFQELQVKFGKEFYTDNDVISHVFSFVFAGFESGTIVLSFGLYELGANIDVQTKLRKEIEEVLETEGKLTFDSIQKMSFLSKCVKETLRMHPPASFVGKRSSSAFRLPSIGKNSTELLIEPGTPFIIPIYSLHYDNKYFPDPHKFDPERFNDTEEFAKFPFFPFGIGPRICVGKNFGMIQVKVALVYLVLNYDIRVNSKTITPLEVIQTYLLLSAKGGIWLDFIKRNKNKYL